MVSICSFGRYPQEIELTFDVSVNLIYSWFFRYNLHLLIWTFAQTTNSESIFQGNKYRVVVNFQLSHSAHRVPLFLAETLVAANLTYLMMTNLGIEILQVLRLTLLSICPAHLAWTK